MGFFSNDEVTSVGTSVMRLIVDKSVPNCILSGQTKALAASDDQLIEYMIEEISTNMGTRAERMFSYAKKNYQHGLPSSTVMADADGSREAAKAIALERGVPVVVQYYRCGSPNKLHFGWKTLTETYGYDDATNEIVEMSKLKLFKVYLDDMIIVLKPDALDTPGSLPLDLWGKAPNSGVSPGRPMNTDPDMTVGQEPKPFQVDPMATDNYLLVTYSYTNDKGKIINDLFRIVIPEFPTGKDYYQVRYTYGAGKIGYWTYRDDSGTHPVLDAVLQTEHTVNGSYFPFTYFRFNKQSEEVNKGSATYKTSSHMMKKLGLNYEDLVTSINSNPDIKDVEQAMMMFALPAHSKTPIECRYLFEYFTNLYDADVAQYPEYVNTGSVFSSIVNDRLAGSTKGRTIVIQDKKLSTALSYTLLNKSVISGKVDAVGKIGTYTADRVIVKTPKAAATVSGGIVNWTSSNEHFSYKYQVSEGMYIEIQVHGLRMVYQIYNGYSSIGQGGESTLLIPIDQSISRLYNSIDREVLYARSIHMIFNSRVTTTLPWYASTWFKIVLVIVMIIVTVLTFGATLQGLVAALAAGTITVGAFAYAVLLMILEAIVIAAAAKLFVRKVGGKVALIVALIAAAAGYASQATNNEIISSMWAETLVQVSTGLVKGVSQDIQESITGLQSEIKAFNELSGAKVKELEVANTLLDSSNTYAPLVIWGETPKAFYNRTVHSGNVGVLGIDAVSSYFDAALTLPNIYDSLRNT